MRITVVIPSRQRVRGLAAALTSLRLLESGAHAVTYGVCCDDDDPATSLFCAGLQGEMPLAFRVGPRPQTLGGLVNDMAERMPADVYLALCDDVLCLTPNWDEVVAAAVEKTPHGVFWCKNALPMETLYAVVTETWRQAAGGIFPDHYPFWYADLCLIETWMMATDADPVAIDLTIADKPANTLRMRDLAFWQDFFTLTRDARVEQGREIAARLGLPAPALGEELGRRLTAALTAMPAERLAEIERNQGDTSPPDAAYLAAKTRATTVMDLHRGGHAPLRELLALSPAQLWHLANEHPGYAA